MKTVYVGLSGGVDSAVSATLLQKSGYNVVGLFARISLAGYTCTAGEDRRDALRVATHLGIPFAEIDLSEAYRERVFSDTLAGYLRGETPNPDALCNREIKFGLLYDYARSLGADFFATGHYARTKVFANGETHLLAGVDTQKDQSYFLWAVPEERLAQTLFPVGDLRKPAVRELAEKFGLPNARRKDSQGLCFLGAISIEEMLHKELKLHAGDVLNESGEVVGKHHGAALYTVGQRHGFLVPAHDNVATPYVVVATDVVRNTITVAHRDAVVVGGNKARVTTVGNYGGMTIALRETNWIGGIKDGVCSVRFRYRQPLMSAELQGNKVTLSEKIAIPLGQSLVLYRGDRCIGGGIIDSTE